MIRARHPVFRAAPVVSALLCAGCGSDERLGGTLDTGLPGDAILAELDAEQVRTFCEAAVAYGNELLAPDVVLQASCVLSTFLAASQPITEADCRSRVAACVVAGGSPTAPPTACDLLAATPTTCRATVSALEHCVAATARVSSGLLEELSCGLAAATPEQLAALYRRYDLPPPECDLLVSVCPELVSGSSI